MRLVFFGSSAFGLPSVAHLAKHHELVGIVTQPDRPAGRGARTRPTPVASWAADHLPRCPIFKPADVNAPHEATHIRDLDADAWVVIAFGQKLGAPLLDGRFAINLHASILPRWRGAAPINAAILHGDTHTGNTVITLAQRMDAGAMLARSHRPIEPDQTAGDLHDLLASDGPAVIERVLDSFARAALAPEVQDETLATLAPKLSPADGWIDLDAPADHCRRRINALSPWPCVTVTIDDHPIKLLRAAPAPDAARDSTDAHATPGTILDPGRGLVACGDGPLAILEIKPAGRATMSLADFARGRRLAPDTRLIARRPAC